MSFTKFPAATLDRDEWPIHQNHRDPIFRHCEIAGCEKWTRKPFTVCSAHQWQLRRIDPIAAETLGYAAKSCDGIWPTKELRHQYSQKLIDATNEAKRILEETP